MQKIPKTAETEVKVATRSNSSYPITLSSFKYF